MNKIKPEDARYIKLGSEGRFEESCIEQMQTIRLGYRNVPHDWCLQGDWDAVRRWWIVFGKVKVYHLAVKNVTTLDK
jgi:hypothetical protein